MTWYFDWKHWSLMLLTKYDQKDQITWRVLILGPLRVWWTL